LSFVTSSQESDWVYSYNSRARTVKDAHGKVLVENNQVQEVWRKYVEKLLNENPWDNVTPCEQVE